MHNETKLPPNWWLNPWKWVRFYEAAYRQALSEINFADENCDEARSELLEASEKIADLIKERDEHKSSAELFERNYVRLREELSKQTKVLVKAPGQHDVSWKKPTNAKPKPKAKKKGGRK